MDASKSEESVDGIKINDDSKDEADMESLEKMSVPSCRNDASTSLKIKQDNFFEVDKENRPIDREQDKEVIKRLGNSTAKSSVWPAKVNQEVGKAGLNSLVQQDNARVNTEAVCFILSGYNLQRKEFRQVIRRLKGRVCRDSHQWSYQGTHFIAPDPIRRTENFFAAAASGRWILKMDYLTASGEEGRFLAEEPYEWHKNGLSEDGAIDLEAPRKWLLLKERTGHGALYGMRIIIYGDCIAPPLSKPEMEQYWQHLLLTLASLMLKLIMLVTPGMPRADLWVQELLKNEIPCVSFQQTTWSSMYASMGSPLRNIGEVMLICGNESGSVGTGIGTHIDCCDPPLKHVPEEDWFGFVQNAVKAQTHPRKQERESCLHPKSS
ncbi:hypothetical protein L6164_010286 [Bauhinia variegata]|uniref:Uncharacterized protein n=1 Tax=Bauhinia variegata TaxID=167791 RepID=A0ACB9PQ60_BAUVA|nr:hypothetical protein L6164_010286 [Bauhinia variegata]